MDLLNSTKSLVDDPASSNLHRIQRKLEDNERTIYVHMVQLDASHIDFENGMCKGTAETNLVRNS